MDYIDLEDCKSRGIRHQFAAGLPAFRSGNEERHQHYYNEEKNRGAPDFLSPSEWGDLNEIFGE